MMLETARGAFHVVDEGRGPSVVLVHAFPLDATQYASVVDRLAPHVRIVCPSMRGFGGSTSWSEAPSVDAMADDVAAVLEALAIDERVVVGGVSMGGYVTLAFARRHRAKLRAMILADTRADADSDEARANRTNAIAQVERGDLRGFVEAQIAKQFDARTYEANPAVVDAARRTMLASDPGAVVYALQALRERPDARAGLSDIGVPSLVLVGEGDRVTPKPLAEAMAEALRAELRVVPQAGHLASLEQPDLFADAIAGFVATL